MYEIITGLITVLFIRTDRLSCISIRVIIIINQSIFVQFMLNTIDLTLQEDTVVEKIYSFRGVASP